jgi:hypothetical protein
MLDRDENHSRPRENYEYRSQQVVESFGLEGMDKPVQTEDDQKGNRTRADQKMDPQLGIFFEQQVS